MKFEAVEEIELGPSLRGKAWVAWCGGERQKEDLRETIYIYVYISSEKNIYKYIYTIIVGLYRIVGQLGQPQGENESFC